MQIYMETPNHHNKIPDFLIFILIFIRKKLTKL